MPVEPSTAAAGLTTQGPEWQVPGIQGIPPADAPQKPGADGFGNVLAGQIEQLGRVQGEAAGAAQSLADGTATDVSSVVMAVERAKLSMQLASQIRNKGVEAYQEIFHTQV